MEKDNDVIDDVFTDDNDDNGSPSRNKPKSSQGITEKASNVNDDGAMESDNDEDYYVDVPPDSLSPRVNRISKLKSYTDKNRTGRLSRDSLSEKNNHNKSKSKQQSSLEKSSASTRQLRRSHGADNDSEVSPTKRPKKSTSLKKLSEEDKSPTKSLKGRKRNGVNMKTSNVISTKSPSKRSRDSHEDYSNESHKPISELNEKTEEDNNGIIEDDYITTDNHSDDEYVDIQPAVGEIKKTPVSRFLRQVKGKSNLNRKKKSSLSQKRLSATSFATPHDVRPSPKKSILKSGSTTPRYSTSSPLHIYNVTVSDTPKLPQYQEKDKAENRIVWPSTPPVGLRRSRRVRVKPLAYYKCERIEYENPRKGSGIVGISRPSYASPLRSKKMSKIKRYAMMRKKKDPTRRLSTHVGLPPDTNFIDNDGHVECIDPTNGNLVAIECLKVKDQYYYVGPSGNEKKDDDALIITKPIYQKSFAMGQIILRPLCEKGLQRVMDLAMSYYVMKGKVAVTIHESTSIIEEGDMFFVPQGNVYNIKNMRRTEAHLVFFQMFRDD
ncbi:uncharacterized protein LOC141900360 [Tubulanus polymorphus]|uniref:uncharacterized protein LOC141900360 n=1 Tax=Tubulanus polymorphus TaxID=672921 RepID=UPI003DA224D9